MSLIAHSCEAICRFGHAYGFLSLLKKGLDLSQEIA